MRGGLKRKRSQPKGVDHPELVAFDAPVHGGDAQVRMVRMERLLWLRLVPVERAQQQRSERRPQRDGAQRPGQRQAAAVRTPPADDGKKTAITQNPNGKNVEEPAPEQVDRSGTAGEVAAAELQAVRQDQSAGRVVDAEHLGLRVLAAEGDQPVPARSPSTNIDKRTKNKPSGAWP